MKRIAIVLILAMACGALLATQAPAQEDAKAGHKFVGATKCKMCHNSAKQGEKTIRASFTATTFVYDEEAKTEEEQ